MEVWRKSIWVDGFDDFASLLLMEGSSEGTRRVCIRFIEARLKGR
jgi:hypothetical protein